MIVSKFFFVFIEPIFFSDFVGNTHIINWKIIEMFGWQPKGQIWVSGSKTTATILFQDRVNGETEEMLQNSGFYFIFWKKTKPTP